jgi:hypothetical protein
MARIDDLFHVRRARSRLFDEYEPGPVAYVSNGSDTNGVVGFVEPQEGDRVFGFTGIVVNAFSRAPNSCGARIQTPPFIASGRSGNGLLVLEPKLSMSMGQLAYLAAYLNRVHGWRFTWYRQTTKDRFSGLPIPDDPPVTRFPVAELLPDRGQQAAPIPPLRLKRVPLGTLFDLRPGDYHAESDLLPGAMPLVSCGDEDNGVVAFVEAPEGRIYRHQLTIALNGRPLTTKYHPYPFAAKDDVAVATVRSALRLTTLLFVQAMLNRERWRYSYYRKCFMDKLRRFEVALPTKSDGNPDEEGMARVVEATPYWRFLEQRVAAQ